MRMLNSNPEDNRVETKKGQIVNLDDYEEEWHVGHPDDELPPMRTKKLTAVKAKLNEEAKSRGL